MVRSRYGESSINQGDTMGQQKVVYLYDDMDNDITDDVEPVTFALHGATYEIDLGEKHRAELDGVLQPFIDAARLIKKPRAKAAAKPSKPVRKGRGKAIREWAKANGKKVNERGAIPRDLEAEYDKAMKKQKK